MVSMVHYTVVKIYSRKMYIMENIRCYTRVKKKETRYWMWRKKNFFFSLFFHPHAKIRLKRIGYFVSFIQREREFYYHVK